MSLDAIIAKLDELAREGLKAEQSFDYETWSRRATHFLRKAFDAETAMEFEKLESGEEEWWLGRGRQVGMLEGMSSWNSDFTMRAVSTGAALSASGPAVNPKKVFVVHGHDDGAKETVARYLDRLGLEPVILHEKANEGRTVVEKIEAHSDVSFAIVLLTPDDVGAARGDADKLQPRARQNVVLELGYFLGKLKRSRVCALYVSGVEIPSDYQGVLYVELDKKGAWRTQLAQELSNARLPINVAGLLNS